MKTSKPSMAEAWLQATRSGSIKDAETFSFLLFSECKSLVPPLYGVLTGLEQELIQEACLMLMGSFLLRNTALKDATEASDVNAVGQHLREAIRTCLVFARRRLIRSRLRNTSRTTDEAREEQFGSVNHPRLLKECELTPEQRCSVALGALHLGLEERILTERASEIAELALGGMSGREISRRLGITPSAVSQQLRRVSAQLSILKDFIEVLVP